MPWTGVTNLGFGPTAPTYVVTSPGWLPGFPGNSLTIPGRGFHTARLEYKDAFGKLVVTTAPVREVGFCPKK